jgi:hypothetical protein
MTEPMSGRAKGDPPIVIWCGRPGYVEATYGMASVTALTEADAALQLIDLGADHHASVVLHRNGHPPAEAPLWMVAGGNAPPLRHRAPEQRRGQVP